MWILLSVFAGLLLPAFIMLSRVLQDRHGFGWGKFAMASLWVNVPVVAACTAHVDWSMPSGFIAAVVIGGALYGLSVVPLIECYQNLRPLTVSVLGQMLPAVMLVVVWFPPLNERLTAAQAPVFLLVLAGSVMAAAESRDADVEEHNPLRGSMLMMAALLMAAVGYAIIKWANRELTGLGHEDSGLQLYYLNRIGVLAGMVLLFAIPAARRRMFELPRIGRDAWKFCGNELLIAVFSLFSVLAVAAQPVEWNTGLVSLVYFGVCQMIMFALALRLGEQNLARKATGACIILAGVALLVWTS